MPDRPCPNCQASCTDCLEACSSDLYVDYYRCDVCGHVWTIAKDGSEEIRHVTRLSHGGEFWNSTGLRRRDDLA